MMKKLINDEGLNSNFHLNHRIAITGVLTRVYLLHPLLILQSLNFIANREQRKRYS